MSIPPDSHWRGCAANFPQPLTQLDEFAAQFLLETIYYFNCHIRSPPLADIVYRSSHGEEDIIRHVFRWDRTPHQEAFEKGFRARRQENTPDEVYYNLDHFVRHGSRPLDSRLPASHIFISTTLSSSWHPSLSPGTDVYRYEIYAPGGIWVAETLDDRFGYAAKDEACFPAGIVPQYIRSAQRFRLTGETSGTRRQRFDTILRVNGNFNPQQHPSRLLRIQRPVLDYLDENRTRRPLTQRLFRSRQEKQEGSTHSDATDWYTGRVTDVETYITAAFRSSRTNEAYLFMNDEYVLINYAPGTTEDRVVNGPLPIRNGYPSLAGTAFAEYGIDSAFGSHDGNHAFIFSGNLCAYIDYAPGTRDDKIIKGPTTIAAMFPFFKRTVFESGVDAAFEASARHEAYLFKDKQYALINYGSVSHEPRLIALCLISQGFASLRNTIFENGIDAAFASHRADEAYLFTGDTYACINFAPGTTNDSIIGGIKQILTNWPSLRGILPLKNRGLDILDHTRC